mmetsp:Transcript_50150/g.95797  ORF Transcript_50150/g.95797 Transcript_50150/m.95797 type:complete len:420 (+) Transcript_50150:229-1488(+)|eukprot:CAMPEP_0114228114 /NCGR_PEP_ID=MMETSP0058-20121206/2164_1 /TAXON_ID=36894 /ORGANISM="Pyramimonas parkeae, CCMP726" /LENGTH=419 /DNA_ID=CAMNT_0001339027 /DNA_START=218 /DNA_END=1477 /DNA_ORIENTATION=+
MTTTYKEPAIQNNSEPSSETLAISRSIFKRGGPKRDGPTLLDAEADLDAELHGKMSQLHSAWSASPTALGKGMGVAEWRSTDHLAEVMVAGGKLLGEMGFTKGGKIWLQPEEALFLLETTRLLVMHQGKVLSIQDLHAIMVDHGFSLERYVVYSHLRRLGFIVRRHRAPWISEFSKGNRAPAGGARPHDGCACKLCTDAKKSASYNNSKTKKPCLGSPPRSKNEIIPVCQNPPADVEHVEMATPLPEPRDGPDLEGHLQIAGKRALCEPDLPEAKRSRCAHWLASLSSVETCRVPPWPGAPSPPTSARKWWPAWETAMGASPSTGASKCQVAELAAPDREAVGAHVAPRERATFDVYMPNTDFSRRCPDAISFVLCVCSNIPPSLRTLVEMDLGIHAPIKYCYVSEGVVTIFGLGLREL